MKLKQYQITLSVTFRATHPRKGELTNFKQQFFEGIKKHTIRESFKYWQNIIDEVNAGRGVLNIKQWSGKPYCSPTVKVATITGGLGYQKITVKCRKVGVFITVDDLPLIGCLETDIIANDGLSEPDFKAWFKKDLIDGIIVHFTDLRYS